jgi:hypothetical protein
MRYFVLISMLMLTQPVEAQAWFDEILNDLHACRFRAWADCPDALACFELRSLAKSMCRGICERELEQRPKTPISRMLRADELACASVSQEAGIICEDPSAWRRAEISARADAFDYAMNEYPYLTKLPPDEIVDQVYRVAERGFIALGGCSITAQGRSVTLLYTTALAINRVRTIGDGSLKWEEAQALSLAWLRALRGY